MPNILDPSFNYTPSSQTDIRRTFARERARLAAAKAPVSPRELLGADDDMDAADLHPDLPAMLDRRDFEARR
jgi:hypothetical protein